MELKRFYRTQREVAIALNQLIDTYWNNQIQEDDFIATIQAIYENNHEKLMKSENEYTKVVLQQCGKRRLSLVSKVLGIKE